jgi:hypothetical protein
VAWPTLQDYNEAIQSPQLNFGDPELRAGVVETTALGLPRPITGAFATVYHLRCKNRDWAVRCFQRDFTDHQVRYEAISKHLSASKLPYMVGFDFLPQGIKVAGKWYPILKMEWIKGELLHKYIKRNLNDVRALLSLAEQWVAMIKALQASNIAHGDLQHGNVLIANNELRLIDYDGMFVPALAGHFSHEAGHRNYQHPRRTEFDFGPTVDNFSAWVIYVSLLALSIDPGLWNRADAGDERLLFRREDFEEPYTSKILTELSNHSDERLYTLANLFQSFLYDSPAQIPTLERQPTSRRLSISQQVTRLPTNALPLWLQDHVPSSQSVLAQADRPQEEDSTWVLDFIRPAATVDQKLLEPDVLKPRILILVSALTCGLLFVLYFVTVVSRGPTFSFIFVTVVTLAGLLRSLYRTDPVVLEMSNVKLREVVEQQDLETSHESIGLMEARKGEARKTEAAKSKTIESQLAALQAKERIERGHMQAQLNSAINTFNLRRQAINKKEAEALRKIHERVGAVVARLNNQIAALIAGERDELANTLQTLQEQAVRAYLINRPIEDGTIYGVGDRLKARLRYAGIRTAADVEYWRVSQVDGIGISKASALIAWRNHLASFAKVPVALSISQAAVIQAKYTLQKQQLQAQRDFNQQQMDLEVKNVRTQAESEMRAVRDEQFSTQTRADQQLQTISTEYGVQNRSLTQKRSSASAEAKKQCDAVDEEIRQVRKRMGEQHWRLATTHRELISYKNVSFKSYLRSVLRFSKS